MTFPEIFSNFKNHEYIRRGRWHKEVFIQYRTTTDLIRMVQFFEYDAPFVIDNDFRLSAADLVADDWTVIDEEKAKQIDLWIIQEC
jgi:hypothetical protein